MNIMIVEDEALLALELEYELHDAGHEVIGPATTSKQAFEFVEIGKVEFAFVDINLLDGPTGIEVGRSLAEANIPFVFMTGNVKMVPQDFAGAIGVIEKPYTANGLHNALNYLQQLITGASVTAVPPGLLIAP